MVAFTGVNAQRRYSPLANTDLTITILNQTQPDSKNIEFDVYYLDTDASNTFEVANTQLGILLNSATYNAGTITAAIIAGTSEMNASQIPTSVAFTQAQNCMKVAPKNASGSGSGTVISTVAPGTRIGRFRLTNTVDWAACSVANLTFNFTTSPYPTKCFEYISGISTQIPTSATNCTNLGGNGSLNCSPPTWTGTVSTDWFTAGNWSMNAVPGSSTNITIPFPVTNYPVIAGATTAVCGTATVQSGATITVNGKFSPTGILSLSGTEALIINDGGSFIDNGISGTGTAKVLKAMGTNKMHFISPPISDATSGIFAGDWLITYSADYSNGWLAGNYIINATTALVPEKGYGAFILTSHVAPKVFSGHLNTNAPAISCIPQSIPTAGTGYNLVGNAYASAIDLANAAITWPSVSHTAYFWDPVNMTYKIYTTVSPTHTQYAPAMQGFFIEAPSSGNFQVPNSARVHNSEAFIKDGGNYPNVLQISATSQLNGMVDEAVVGFVPGTTSGYDFNFDALKLAGGTQAPQLYTTLADSKKVAFNIQPYADANTVVPMGFTSGVTGGYTLNASNLESFGASARIYLEDLKEGTIQDLKANPVYSFSYSTEDAASRFVLHFSNVTGISDAQNDGIQVYSYQTSLYIKNLDKQQLKNVFVYDLLGKEVFSSALNTSPLQKFVLNLNQGYYVVKVVSQTGVSTKKIYID